MLLFTNENPNTYKTGYLVQSTGVNIAFRYSNMDKEQIERAMAVSGLEINSAKKVIKTISGIDFQTKDKIKLNGVIYQIISISTEDMDNENGMFTSNVQKIKYLSLTR